MRARFSDRVFCRNNFKERKLCRFAHAFSRLLSLRGVACARDIRFPRAASGDGDAPPQCSKSARVERGYRTAIPTAIRRAIAIHRARHAATIATKKITRAPTAPTSPLRRARDYRDGYQQGFESATKRASTVAASIRSCRPVSRAAGATAQTTSTTTARAFDSTPTHAERFKQSTAGSAAPQRQIVRIDLPWTRPCASNC